MKPSDDAAALATRIADLKPVPTPREEAEAFLRTKIVPGGSAADVVGWLTDLERLSRNDVLSLTAVRGIISDLGWADREAANPVYSTATYVALLDPASPEFERVRLFVEYFVSQRLRFDFRFETMLAESKHWPDLATDSQLASMVAYGNAGSRSTGVGDEIAELREKFEPDSVTRDILLHALWFASQLPDQATRILDLSDEILAHGGASANVYFRRAYAFRRQGRIELAQSEIRTAIELLGAGQNEIHQDYVRELELIETTSALQEHVKSVLDTQLALALSSLDERARAAEETVSRSLVGLVEVLGLFVAIIAFLGTSVMTLFSQQSITIQLLTIVLLFIGSIGFFLTLRIVVQARSLRFRGRRRT